MRENSLLYYHEATEAAVSVWNTEFTLSLRTNGKIEASSHGDMVTQKLISHLPTLYHREEPKNALMIGLASGISVGALLTYPFERVDTVELIPCMAEAARYFDDYNHRCLQDPRHRLILNDGRNHLLLTGETYDVIVSEPSNPWIAGVGSLFTREFFELTKKRLAPGGVVCQWVQTYQMQEEDLRTILSTFFDAYPYLHLWQGAPGDLILVASLEPLRIDLDRLGAAAAGKPGEDLAALEILPLPQLLSLFVTDREGIGKFLGGWSREVTDDNLYLEYAIPRHMFLTRGQVDVHVFDRVATSPVPYLTGSGLDSSFVDALDRYRRARNAARAAVREPYPEGGTARLAALEQALTIAPGEAVARELWSREVNEQGIQALLAGRALEAAPLFRDAARRGTRSERALALNNLGTIAFAAGDLDSAGGFWVRALAEEPNYLTVLGNLGMLCDRKGEHREALPYLRRARGLNPSHGPTLNNLAYQLAILGEDLDKAEALSRRAVSLDPTWNHRDTLGYVLLRRRQWDKAEKVLTSVVKEHPEAYEALLHLGMTQAGLGRTEEARSSFRSVIEKSPNRDQVRLAQEELQKL